MVLAEFLKASKEDIVARRALKLIPMAGSKVKKGGCRTKLNTSGEA